MGALSLQLIVEGVRILVFQEQGDINLSPTSIAFIAIAVGKIFFDDYL
jgi:preprotein translocase subunit Sec61beta